MLNVVFCQTVYFELINENEDLDYDELAAIFKAGSLEKFTGLPSDFSREKKLSKFVIFLRKTYVLDYADESDVPARLGVVLVSAQDVRPDQRYRVKQ